MEQSFLHSHSSTVSLTSFQTGSVLDRQSPGWFPIIHESGDYRTMTLPSGRPVHSHRALPKCRYRPNWLPPTPPESPDYFRHPPAGYSRTALSLCAFTHNRMSTNMSGLSPYCCYTRPGFHRTAVLDVQAFTVQLFYS